jgi:Fur family peroxide stress response transcriptional regulator
MGTSLIPTHTWSASNVKIVDPHLASLDEMKKEVASETNFKILNHRLDFFGICSSCMAENG